jgi:hypothetical protein
VRKTASALLALPLLAGCGSAATTSAPPTTSAAPPAKTTAAAGATTQSSPGAPPLQAEAQQAAAGDIPDNQAFVAYQGSGYTIRVPEGWAQSGSAGSVTFRDKNNIIRIVVRPGTHPAARTSYRSRSAPNPVTGKRVTLVVVRYYKRKGGKTAIIDLAGPEGVDNVDAYRMIANSFRWK